MCETLHRCGAGITLETPEVLRLDLPSHHALHDDEWLHEGVGESVADTTLRSGLFQDIVALCVREVAEVLGERGDLIVLLPDVAQLISDIGGAEIPLMRR